MKKIFFDIKKERAIMNKTSEKGKGKMSKDSEKGKGKDSEKGKGKDSEKGKGKMSKDSEKNTTYEEIIKYCKLNNKDIQNYPRQNGYRLHVRKFSSPK
jgi:hypothetical protein